MSTDKKSSPVTVVLTALAVFVCVWFVRHNLSTHLSPEDALAQTVVELNKKMPMKADEVTRVNSVEKGPGRTIIYHNTILTLTAAQLPPGSLNKLKPTILEIYRKNESLKTFREMGVTMIYTYDDKNGVRIGEVEVKPEEL